MGDELIKRSPSGRFALWLQNDGVLIETDDNFQAGDQRRYIWTNRPDAHGNVRGLHISPPDEPEPPGPEPAPGTLPRLYATPVSRFLVDDTGAPVDIREATLFSAYRLWLDGRGAKLQTVIDTLKREGGINSVRVLLNLAGPFWDRPGHRFGTDYREPGFFGGLVSFVRFLNNNGVYVHLGLIGSVENFGAAPDFSTRPDVVSGDPAVISRMLQYVNQAVDTLDGMPGVIWQIANEPAQLGFGSDSLVILELARETSRILSLAGWDDAPLDLGAQGEGEHFYHQAPASAFAYHLLRDGQDDHNWSLKRLIGGDADVSGPVYDEEAMNLGDLSRLDGRTDLADGTESTATAFAYACCSRIKNVAIVAFHSHEGLFSRCDRAKTINALRAWRRGLDLIPHHTAGAQWNGGHTGTMLLDPDSVFPEFTNGHKTTDEDLVGPLRVFGRDQWAISLREPDAYDLGLLPGVQIAHVERWGAWQARLLQR